MIDNELDLIERNKRLVSAIARKFVGGGISQQDLYQEGMIALFRAIKTYRETGGAKFETYASKCITNRLIDITRKERNTEQIYELFDSVGGVNLETEIDLIERTQSIKKVLNSCTEIERAVFNSFMGGLSYAEISKIFEIAPKKIDNTIQKIRNRIKAEI
jgi:RNA polymerase sporulation-specific sigma factor